MVDRAFGVEFGVSFLPDCAPSNKGGAQFYRDAIALSVEAEQLGYGVTKITEHYLHPYGGYCPDPLMFLAAVAAKTSRIRLMTGGVIAPFHHPVQLASRVAMADALSGGRIELGFVRGFLPFEFDALGVPLDDSRARFEATVSAVDQLLHGEQVSITTPYFSFSDATILPRPVQPDGVPIWTAATVAPESFAYAATNRYDLSLVLAFRRPAGVAKAVQRYRAAHPEGRVSLFAPLVIDRDAARAEQIARRHLAAFLEVWRDAAASWSARTSPAYSPMYGELASMLNKIDYEQMAAMGTTFFGTPDQVRRQLDQLLAVVQPTHILWNLDIGAMPYALSRNTLRLFAEHVMPAYR